MIIGIDASRANRGHKSGTEWYSYYLIKNLACIDDKNEYILYTDKPLIGGLLNLEKEDIGEEFYKDEKIKFDKNGFQIIKSPYNNFKAKVLKWPFVFFWTLGRLSMEMLLRRIDVLFIPAHSIPLIRPKKTIATVHDVAFLKREALYRKENLGSENKNFRKIVNLLVRIFTLNKYRADSIDYLKWSTKFTLKHAKKIITVSVASKNDILGMYSVSENKIKVVYNGYNNKFYTKRTDEKKIEEVLEKYGLERPYILYVGRLEKKKNMAMLIEGYARAKYNNKDLKENLVLAGDAGHGYDEAIYNITGLDLQPSVYITGWVEEDDLPYIFSASKAFIFPSIYEGFGIPILQAFGTKTPVTSSCIPPFREIVKQAILYFNPLDRNEIADSINKIVSDEHLRGDLIRKGSERVSHFSWEKCARDTLKEIEEM